MNENLNLSEILKDCPKGTKFYSTIYGDVYFEEISDVNKYHPIRIKIDMGSTAGVTVRGLLNIEYDGECTLFPSKDQRDWSKWHIPFVDGDIIFTEARDHWLSIFKRNIDEKCETYVDLCIEENRLFNDTTYLCNNSDIIDQRLATEDEKQKLFDVIRKKGYKWNAEKKVLEKLIVPKFKDGDRIKHKDSGNILKIDEIDMSGSIYCCGLDYVWVSDQDNYELVPNKFDPKTLIPFESKVLVRDGDHFSWVGSIYTHRKENGFYTVNGTYYRQCIPYNDDTAYLIGTYKEAPEYYRYWED